MIARILSTLLFLTALGAVLGFASLEAKTHCQSILCCKIGGVVSVPFFEVTELLGFGERRKLLQKASC